MKNTLKCMLLVGILFLFVGCGKTESASQENVNTQKIENTQIEKNESEGVKEQEKTIPNVPEYKGEAYVVLNGNEPEFTDEDMSTESYEFYSELDEAGRCGVVKANLGQDLMPKEERGSIGQVKPSGWKTVKYENVDGKYLYNRCHLIGFQLSGENANEKNLITGTRYMNVDGMLPFENMVADYIKETGNHVLYRVTPFFEGDNLVASGVQMEAKSVEDNGEGILFNVYVYNVQPGIKIDYATGESWLDDKAVVQEPEGEIGNYIINKNTRKFHYEDCSSVKSMKEHNKEKRTETRNTLISEGYEPCGNCNP